MFPAARHELDSLTISGLSRANLEFVFEQLSSLESAVSERRLSVMAALDDLDDGGLDSAGVARSKGKSSARRAKKSAKTARKLKKMPKTREKLAKGEISEEHADSAADAAERVGDAERADDELSTQADCPADMFEERAREWASENEPDDEAEDRAARRKANRRLKIFDGDDDMVVISGQAHPEIGAQLAAAIEEEYDRLWRADGGRDGDPLSVRTPEQRRLDALANLILRHGESAAPGSHPKYQGLVLVPLARYLEPHDAAADPVTMTGGGALPPSVIERMLCDAELAALIVDTDGTPLWLGRNHRTASIHQWKALIARDRGCVICGAAPFHCQAHHIVWWEHQGTSDIDNLVLLCTHHHHQLHDHNHQLVQKAGKWRLIPRAGPSRRGSNRPKRTKPRGQPEAKPRASPAQPQAA